MDSFRDVGCTRASALVSGDIVDVSLTWAEGAHFVPGQLVRLQLAFTAARPFLGLGAVIRIFDQSGRCAFANRFVDLDVATICRSLEPGRNVMVVQLVAALPAGWYALTFSLAENTSGNFSDPDAWNAICEQTCYAPFYVGDGSELSGDGYCRLPIHAYLAPQGSQDAVVGKNDSFPEFPWVSDRPLYSVAQVVAALHELIPGLDIGHDGAAQDLLLSPDCAAFVLPANHPRLHTQVGQRTDRGMAASGEAGALLFGPYMLARPGQYKATFTGCYRLPAASPVTVDIVASQGTVVFGCAELSVAEDSATGEISFVVPEPGVNDLEFRVLVGPDVGFEIQRIEVVSADEDDPLRTALRSALRWTFPVRESVVMVLVPAVYWLPFALGIAEESQRQFGKRSVFVFLQNHPIFDRVENLAASVIGAIDFRELPKADFQDVYAVVVHDFGWRAQGDQLLQRYSGAQHWVYVDGFRGELCAPARYSKTAEMAFFFGHVSGNPDGVGEICVPASELVRHVRAIAAKDGEFDPGEPKSREPENLAVIYMRYWGVGVYSIGAEEIANSILATLRAVLPEGVLVVVKDDPRVSREVLAVLLDKFREDGVQWSMLDDYLESIGIDRKYAALDAAYLFAKGILVSAEYHFVFDSTVGFYIAEELAINKQTSIVFGVLNDEWAVLRNQIIDNRYIDYILRCDGGMVEKTAAGAVSIIRHYAKRFALAVCPDVQAGKACNVVELSETCFMLSLKKQA